MTIPQTRAEARAAAETSDDSVVSEGEHYGEAHEPERFLPLGVRRVLYVIALAAFAAGPVLAVTHPEYGTAIITSGNVLGTAAIGTALANPTR